MAFDQRVEAPALGLDTLHELARELLGVSVEQVRGRAVGHVLLVERDRRGAALLGPAHQARETYSPERVSTRTRSPTSTNSGTRTVTPDSSVAGLSPPPDAVSPLTPGCVSDTVSSTALGTWTSAGLSST